MDQAAILRRARVLITDKTKWTQGEYARDKDGDRCLPDEPRAVCWCANGAYAKAAHEAGYNVALHFTPLDIAAREIAGEIAELINDGEKLVGEMTPHEAVLVLFDVAIGHYEGRS